jgi:hypothetical protein
MKEKVYKRKIQGIENSRDLGQDIGLDNFSKTILIVGNACGFSASEE